MWTCVSGAPLGCLAVESQGRGVTFLRTLLRFTAHLPCGVPVSPHPPTLVLAGFMDPAIWAGVECVLLVSVCVSLVSGGISFSRHWVFGSQATLRVFPPICLVLVHGQGLHVSGGSAPTVLAAPCGAADESRFLTTAPLCSSVFLVKMCIFLFNKF